MPPSTSARAARFILRETLGDLLYFPIWWYSLGIVTLVRGLIREWRDIYNRLALRILFKNMGRPMYADYTRSGRVISFFFRLIILFARLVLLAGWTAIEVILIGLWVAGPLVAAALLVRQIIPI